MDALLLEAQLLLIVHVQEITAAAGTKGGTGGGYPMGRGVEQGFDLRPGDILRTAEDANLTGFARDGAFDEDYLPINPRNALALGGVALDVYGMQLVFGEWHGVVTSGC